METSYEMDHMQCSCRAELNIPPSRIQMDEERPDHRFKIFRARHITLMALGTSSGLGLLFESGTLLQLGGPACVLLSYIWTGSVTYCVMVTLGEMISFLPLPGAVFTLAGRVLTPALVLAGGWSYFFGYALDYPSKAVLATEFIQFWPSTDSIPPSAMITIFLVIPVLFNLCNVRRYGEIEYWLTTMKILLMLGLIILGLLQPMGATDRPLLTGTSSVYEPVPCSENDPSIGPCMGPSGFGYWREDAFKSFLVGGAAGRLIAFWECSCRSIFVFTGVEMLGIAAEETERQRETLPKAVRRVSHRIIFNYVGLIFVLGLNLSSNDPILGKRLSGPYYPGAFITMVQRANLPELAPIINVVMITAAVSVANADIYVGSRTLLALASEGYAPQFLTMKNRFQVPYFAVAVAALPGPLAYMGQKFVSSNVFGFLSSTTALVIAWAIICLTYLRLRKAIEAQQTERDTVPEANFRLQPYLAIYALCCCIFFVLFEGFKAFTRSNAVWSQPGQTWGFTLAPWAFIACFVILLFLWRWLSGDKDWAIPKPIHVDLKNNAAPWVRPKKRESSTLLWAIFTLFDVIIPWY